MKKQKMNRSQKTDGIYVSTPLKDNITSKLKAGMKIYLSGTVYTARDAAHQRLIKEIKTPPFNLRGAVIFYAGPAEKRPGSVIGSIGPTTSERMDKFTPALLKAGLKGMIGKGPRGKEVIRSIRENSAVYLVSVGGAAALISTYVKKARITAYSDLGCEAIRELFVEKLPLFVGIDASGQQVLQ